MPNVSATLLPAIPFCLRYHIGDSTGCVVLIASHHLQNTVSIIGNSIEPDELVRHRNGQQRGGDRFPIIDRFVVKICPMEIVIRVEFPIGTGVSKIAGFFRVHCNKNLNEREQSCKNALI